MLKKCNKITNLIHPFFFLNVIFEGTKNNFSSSATDGSKYTLNITTSNKIQSSIRNFLELKPISLLDMVTYDPSISKNFFNGGRCLTILYYFSHTCKSYLYISLNIKKNDKIKSSSLYYANGNWLEREQHEFFGVKFKGLDDDRNLFLEYDWDKNIYLKKYNVSDNYDILYDTEEDENLCFSKLKSTTI